MKKKMFYLFIASIIGAFLLLPITVYAAGTPAPRYGFGAGQGRTQPINENDFHTAAWDRFTFQYEFSSGVNHRYELGRPTTWNGNVPVDIFSANVRRDRHVAFVPPRYGIFSGHIPTFPHNGFFQQPLHPAFWSSFELQNPNALSTFDTLSMGVNAPVLGNPMNMHHVGQQAVFSPTTSDIPPAGGFLPPTSVN